MSPVARLQAWYARQCNGDWEYQYGVTIETSDAPGWELVVDLTDTSLQGVPFTPVEDKGLRCRVDRHKWKGAAAPLQLERLIDEFLSWAEKQDR